MVEKQVAEMQRGLGSYTDNEVVVLMGGTPKDQHQATLYLKQTFFLPLLKSDDFFLKGIAGGVASEIATKVVEEVFTARSRIMRKFHANRDLFSNLPFLRGRHLAIRFDSKSCVAIYSAQADSSPASTRPTAECPPRNDFPGRAASNIPRFGQVVGCSLWSTINRCLRAEIVL
jgi:hypothetical protein